MTEQTPATEALTTRAILDAWVQTGRTPAGGWTVPRLVAAIQAEARAEHWNEGYRAGYSIGRADALRDAAERVRAMPRFDHGITVGSGDGEVDYGLVRTDDGLWTQINPVLAILDPQP